MILRALRLGCTPPWPVGEATAEEDERARALVDPRRAHEFLAGRRALRGLVAEASGLDTERVQPAYECPDCGVGEHGSPRFAFRADDDDGLVSAVPVTASASRAGGWALFAVELLGDDVGRAIGVDLVAVADFQATIPGAAFSPAERRHLGLAARPALAAARLWARKEALLKALGTGLRADPATVQVLADPRVIDVDTTRLGLPEGFVAAVALSSG
jgi:4'-phosphopantetheinyl transferase